MCWVPLAMIKARRREGRGLEVKGHEERYG